MSFHEKQLVSHLPTRHSTGSCFAPSFLSCFSYVFQHHIATLSLSLSSLPHTRDKKSHGSDQPQYIIPLRIRTKWKVCGLLMPPSARKVYFALRTFNVKISSIKDSSHLVAIRVAARGRQSRFKDNNAFGDDSSSLATRL